ncbi:lipoprotein-anchoring transpeptidase ErfK/SrfK [Sphingomonas sp. SORGH_AS802]|uniref:L,D-transpeptidase family protein n=1 Tax=unclassified Sphingomonas TaxID=196159 RepID=UPI00285D3331|nr:MULTISPECIES: L,D-transpeptidase family protein [unclassified Sphingomonas]MDR6128124.1 lipoprotein-anchoring transpeptidase ErfK/SrfK [Sphingomonas sp. SORGH_AS_0438]MDR6135670.1 lipoprotein-anchoring transpeptidase ErfK/SrfK [Sphingomonas sp. SORGH_AS_0802]
MRRLAWLVAAMPLLVLAYLAIAPDRAPVAQPRVEQPYRRAEGRLIFASDKVPSLALPDGSHRRVRSVLDIPQAMHFGDYVWNDTDVPAGPVWVRVDLGRQLLSVFRAGHEIGSAVILYGTDGMPTPTGVFPIKAKAAEHESSLYEASMPFMLRLTDDGVAIHASLVQRGSATHGCVGIPESFARRLFAQVKLGDPVAILPADAPSSGKQA